MLACCGGGGGGGGDTYGKASSESEEPAARSEVGMSQALKRDPFLGQSIFSRQQFLNS
jgi:hypothetical protein